MDGLQFDAWTRRRFGIAAGSIATWLLGQAARDDADARRKGKKKRRRKRCKKLGADCRTNKGCCRDLVCGPYFGARHAARPKGAHAPQPTSAAHPSSSAARDFAYSPSNGSPRHDRSTPADER